MNHDSNLDKNKDASEGIGFDECVEPDLGKQLWRLDDPDTQSGLKELLEGHLSVCAECRLERALGKKIVAGLEANRLTLNSFRKRLPKIGVFGGSVLVAASVVLALLLPPNSNNIHGVERAQSGVFGFQRPVSGEIVGTRPPRLQWGELDGATGYVVSVLDLAGSRLFQSQTSSTHFDLPDTLVFSSGEQYWVYLEPIPKDIAPDDVVSVRFLASGELSRLWYRMETASIWLQMGAVFGVLIFGFGLLGGRFLSRNF